MDGKTSSVQETVNCQMCHKPFETGVFRIGSAKFHAIRCPSCEEMWKITYGESLARDKAAAHERGWCDVCPQIYRDTDLTRLKGTGAEIINAWQPSKGLGFIGPTGAGKTRLLFVALRRCYDAGASVAAVSHNRFSFLAQDAFAGEDDARSRARSEFRKFKICSALLIDDLGKAPRTERADAEIEELVEHRTSHGLPILFTANASGEWLSKRFGEDRGPALVRRLGEFCEVHTL